MEPEDLEAARADWRQVREEEVVVMGWLGTSKRGVIDGGGGGSPVAHLIESGTKHPSGWVILRNY